jgi:hypothetical protein
MKSFIIPVLVIVLLTGCDQINKISSAVTKNTEADSDNTDKTKKKKRQFKRDGLVVNKRKDGSVLSEINLKDGKYHGPAKDYYEDGTLHTEYNYVEGVLENELKVYHKNGKLYKVTPYLHGKIHGVEKVYGTDGKLMAEHPYKNGYPGIGFKEYSSNGKVLPAATILIEEIDNIALKGEYILKISLSDKSRNVKFYIGELTEGKFMNDNLTYILTKNGIGEMRYVVPAGFYAMEKLNIIAQRTNREGSKYITQTRYNLAIENKGL